MMIELDNQADRVMASTIEQLQALNMERGEVASDKSKEVQMDAEVDRSDQGGDSGEASEKEEIQLSPAKPIRAKTNLTNRDRPSSVKSKANRMARARSPNSEDSLVLGWFEFGLMTQKKWGNGGQKPNSAEEWLKQGQGITGQSTKLTKEGVQLEKEFKIKIG